MFFHSFKYSFIACIRNREEVFWLLLFPMLLGTMFYIAFGSLYDSQEIFKVVPVAIIYDDTDESKAFKQIADELSKEGDDQLLNVVTNNEDEALTLLEGNEIVGIIYSGDTLSLSFSSNVTDVSISQSILESFLNEYIIKSEVITDVAMNHPEKLADIIASLENDINYNKEIFYTNGDMDPYNQYFYNLIAMFCLYTSIAGLSVAVGNQANLSPLGARKASSPINRFISALGELSGTFAVQLICLCAIIFYLTCILKVNLGSQLPLVLLTSIMGIIVGMSYGFLVGSISNISSGSKVGILMSVTMVFCFLSGLMVANMKSIVESICPIANKLNPATIIADCFYSLNIYDTYDRFFNNILSLAIISSIFIIGGILLKRRSRYASI